jgi:3-hydroxymyristoyl/3-hydroxydecanoyl-(acyl carrier protein) dehydratase
MAVESVQWCRILCVYGLFDGGGDDRPSKSQGELLILPKQADSQPVLFPEILGKKRATDSIVLALRIPGGLAYFAGHFDEIAVVPGVVQIQWAVHYARQYLGVARIFSQMEAIKFKELLLPGQCLDLSLCYYEAHCKLQFSYRSETTEYSSGRIYFYDRHV